MKKAVAFLALLIGATSASAQPAVVKYYHLDGLGSVRALTDQAGNVIERHEYLPFGEEWNPQPSEQPLRFTGKERDVETGLDYFGARYFGAEMGRFTTVDPVYTWRENLVDPQRWNRYAYVRNNPLRYTDPDGRAIETPWDVLNVALDVTSLASNIAAGNIGGAAVDAAGLILDVGATLIPGAPGGAGTAIKAARTAEKATDVLRAAEKADDARSHIVYTIRGVDDEVQYVGRASGRGTPDQVLRRRASSHEHRGAGEFKIEDVQGSRAANRGAEDVIYNRERLGAEREGRTLLNRTNPVSERNPRGRSYIDAYVREQQR